MRNNSPNHRMDHRSMKMRPLAQRMSRQKVSPFLRATIIDDGRRPFADLCRFCKRNRTTSASIAAFSSRKWIESIRNWAAVPKLRLRWWIPWKPQMVSNGNFRTCHSIWVCILALFVSLTYCYLLLKLNFEEFTANWFNTTHRFLLNFLPV